MSDNGSIDHINNFSDAEYNEWLDVQNEAAYWEAMHRQIDEYIFKAGRVSRIVDDMTKIAKDNGWKANKKHKYADMIIPF